MRTREKLVQARVSILALVKELQNISRACKVAGISRSHFYDVKEAFEKYGPEWFHLQARRRPRIPNQTPPELEQQILAMTKEYPIYSYVKIIADQLTLVGVAASPAPSAGCGSGWGLLKVYDRLV